MGKQVNGLALYVTVLTLLVFAVKAEVPVYCGRGEYLAPGEQGQPDKCEQCPNRYYQDQEKHRETQCKVCSPFDHFKHQLVLEDQCTSFSYKIIECIEGYYLKDGDCQKCTDCTSVEGKLQAQACQKDQDTICCNADGRDGHCQVDLLYCGPGEHLLHGHNGQLDKCVHCRSGFYQDKASHREKHCHQCSYIDEHDTRHILVDDCTRFHDAVFKCHNGFFLNEDQCEACQDCSLLGKTQGRACQEDQDTICCDHEEMVVRDGKCEVKEIHCGPGEYLIQEGTGKREQCRPCETGTTNPEHEHRKTVCVADQDKGGSTRGSGSSRGATVTHAFWIITFIVISFVFAYVIRKVVPRFMTDGRP
ncbi:hypothetical protein ElyMa_005434500 [Elysia marginata]|uniref:TNFR-Cys domain-containing protein n=1 Tax=Elysia marginata TaxID=1093978 RepID=A0AAV4EKC7_9GAST|nr:hypothetical protein ElyMa_005434500 [Elysia marginata]